MFAGNALPALYAGDFIYALRGADNVAKQQWLDTRAGDKNRSGTEFAYHDT